MLRRLLILVPALLIFWLVLMHYVHRGLRVH